MLALLVAVGLLLLIACGAWLLFSREQDWLAGALLALGLFRFQLVLPIAGLMFLGSGGDLVITA